MKDPAGHAAEHGQQITAHLHATERAAFEAYARKFGLDPAGLLALLLARELRVARLASLLVSDVAPPDARGTKVTVHGRDALLREGVAALAAKNGVSVSLACAVLIRAELRESWLDRAVVTRFESP
jgi:hypothetical protein